MTDRLRKVRAEQRKRNQAAFAEDNAMYQGILDQFQSRDSRRAAWQWITTTWSIADPGTEPGELVWDERCGAPVVQGREPQTLEYSIGQGVRIELVWMEPGMFLMGSPDNEPFRDPEETQHSVMIPRGFWMAATETTQDQWRRVMGSAPSYFTFAGPNAPVERVSWYDAQYFMLKLNLMVEEGEAPWFGAIFHLPSESEWEYACRAGTTTPIYTGSFTLLGANHAPELDVIAWYGGNSGVAYPGGWDATKWRETQYTFTTAGTHPVGLKQPNAWGLYDMIGNVWEWCADAHAPYSPQTVLDRAFDPAGTNRVLRGASWGNMPTACRAAARNAMSPDARHNRVGFRIAASW